MTSTDETPPISALKPPAPKPSSCSPGTKLSTRQSPPNHHTILLLSDSALPLGSFAFSSGLESHLAHNTTSSSSSYPPGGDPRGPPSTLLPHFLSLSLHSLCTTSLPHLLAAHSHPQHITEIDTIFDASTLCPVARRASIAQGRALLTLWDRAFRDSSSSSSSASGGGRGGGGGRDNDDDDDDDGRQGPQQQRRGYNNNNNNTSGVEEEGEKRDRCTDKEARNALSKFSLALKRSFVGMSTFTISTTTKTTNTNDDETTGEAFFEKDQHQHHHLEAPSGHFSPLWGLVTRALKISARDSVYVFLLNHAKSVVSAAVRASVMGPYQAQGLLGSVWLRRELERLVDRALEDEEKEQELELELEDGYGDGDGWRRKVEEAGQGVPAMDIWLGRHELLYSRIFNS